MRRSGPGTRLNGPGALGAGGGAGAPVPLGSGDDSASGIRQARRPSASPAISRGPTAAAPITAVNGPGSRPTAGAGPAGAPPNRARASSEAPRPSARACDTCSTTTQARPELPGASETGPNKCTRQAWSVASSGSVNSSATASRQPAQSAGPRCLRNWPAVTGAATQRGSARSPGTRATRTASAGTSRACRCSSSRISSSPGSAPESPCAAKQYSRYWSVSCRREAQNIWASSGVRPTISTCLPDF